MKKILFAALIGLALSGCNVKTGDGEKIGMVTKVAKQGMFCPTWEAEIIRGGFNGGTGVSGQAFDFTINSDEEAKQVQMAMEQQKEIKLTYVSRGFTFCTTDSGHFMTTLQVLEKKADPKVDSEGKLKSLIREIIAEVQK